MAIKVHGNAVADFEAKAVFPTHGSSVDITTIGNTNDDAVKLPRLVKKGDNWDITTASYTGNFQKISSQGGTPSGMFFKPDGKVMFTVGESGDSVSAWDLTTPWNVSTAVYRERLYIGFHAKTPRGIYFRPDGHRMYIYDLTYRSLREYVLDVAWSINSASFLDNDSGTVERYYIGYRDTAPNGVFITPDGGTMITLGDSGNDWDIFTLQEPWKVSTADHVQNFGYVSLITGGGGTSYGRPSGWSWKPDGTGLIMTEYAPSIVHEFSFSTAWDVTTASYVRSYTLPGISRVDYAESVEWGLNGNSFFVVCMHNDIIAEFTVSSAYSLTGATFVGAHSVADLMPSPSSLKFADNGNVAYMTGSSADRIYAFDLDSPYSLDKLTYRSSMDVGFQSATPRSLYIRDNNLDIYCTGSSGDDIRHYTLSAEHDLASVTGSILPLFEHANEYTGLFFKPDGTRLFMVNSTGGCVEEYALQNPWQISGATLVQQKGTISQRDPRGIWIRGDGNRLFIVGEAGDYVDSYYLSTSWDISTMTFERNFSIGSKETTPRSVFFKTDGSKFWALGYSSDTVWEYDLTNSRLVFESNVDIGSDAEIGGNLTVGKEIIAQGRIDAGDVRTDYIKVENNLRFGNDGVINPAMDTDLAISQRVGELGQFDYNDYDTKVNDVWISPDGTKMFALGGTNRRMHYFTLTTPNDINTRVYDGYVDLEAIYGAKEPKGMWFNDAGTQCWIVDYQSFVVAKLTLSTAWDVTTLSFNGNSPYRSNDVSGYLTSPTGIFWKPDGTKFWLTGDSTNAIKEFSTSTDWVITGATYLGQLDTDVLTGTTGTGQYAPNISGLEFSADGTKCYITGNFIDAVLQLTLSTAWDITSASFDSGSITMTGDLPQSSINGIWVKNDGRRVYSIDGATLYHYYLNTAHDMSTAVQQQGITLPYGLASGTGIHMKDDGTGGVLFDGSYIEGAIYFTLSTAWDLNTFSIDGGSRNELDISSRLSTVQGLTLDDSGTRMYLCGSTTADVVQYSLSSAHNITSASHANTLDVSADFSGLTLRDNAISSDGTKLYVVGSANPNSKIVVYDLSTAWNISTATKSYEIAQDILDPYGRLSIDDIRDIKFGNSGTKFYIIDAAADRVYQYNLSTAWNIEESSLTYISDSRTLIDGTCEGVTFDSTGTYLYLMGNSTNKIGQYRLKTPWEISSMEYMKQLWIGHILSSPTCIYITPTGNKLIGAGTIADSVVEFPMTVNYQISSIATGNHFHSDEYETATSAGFMSPDGQYMSLVGSATDRQQLWKLDTAWDLTTAKLMGYNTGTSGDAYMNAVYYSDDGQYVFYYDYKSDLINRYTLGTAWDPFSGYGSRQYVGTASLGGGIDGLAFAGNGTKMYIADGSSDRIKCVTLSTAWDLTTADLGDYVYVGAYEAAPEGLVLKSDGTKMYVVGSSGDEVNQFSLSTAWDISTATYEKNFRVNAFETAPAGFTFKTDGTKFWFLGNTSRSIYEYTLSTAWDVATATYVGRAYIGDLSGNPEGIEFKKSNGGTIFIVDNKDNAIYEYNNITDWTVIGSGGIPQPDILDLKDYDDLPTGVHVKSDGTRLVVVGDTSEDAWQFDMSTAFDIKTATYNSVKYVPNFGNAYRTHDVFFNKTGSKYYILCQYRNILAQYDLSTSWDISTSTLEYVLDLTYNTMYYYASTSSFDGATGICFTDDGTKLLVTNSYNNTITAIGLDIPYDIRSAKLKTRSAYMDEAQSTGAGYETNFGQIVFTSDGRKMFVTGRDKNAVREYDLSTPFDISSSVYNGVQVATGIDGNNYGLHFSPCGYHMYTTGYDSDLLRYHRLSSPFDLSTATAGATMGLGESGSYVYGDHIPLDVYVRYDGKKLYYTGEYSTKLVEFDLSTPFDISTATFNQYRSVADAGHYPRAFTFRADGTRVYFVEDERDTFIEYKLTTPWDISTMVLHRKKKFPYGFYNPQGLAFSANGDYVYFTSRHNETIVQVPITENYLSIEGQVAVNGGFTIGGNMITTRNVSNYGNYGFGTDTPQTSIDASGRQDGIVFPTGTTAERPGNAPAGTVRYNTDNSKLEICLGGGSWTNLH
jgi:sugar lactone lactonase YvrE